MRRLLWMLVVVGVAVQPAAAQPVLEYYHVDALGSVRAVTDASAAVVRRHDYLPFGEENGVPGSDTRRFTGKERDGETGLDYFGARYYRSQSGRFTTVDPGHANGNVFDPQSWNAYAYARNNPLRFVDPTGTDYRVRVFGGDSFWVETDQDLRGLEQGGFAFRGGNIFNAAGTWVGTYNYFSPFDRALIDAVDFHPPRYLAYRTQGPHDLLHRRFDFLDVKSYRLKSARVMGALEDNAQGSAREHGHRGSDSTTI